MSICAVDLCCVVLQANVAQFLNDVPNILPLCCRLSLQTRFVTRRSCAWVGGPLPYPVGPPRLPTHYGVLWILLEPTVKVSHSALCEVTAHLRHCCTTERNSLYNHKDLGQWKRKSGSTVTFARDLADVHCQWRLRIFPSSSRKGTAGALSVREPVKQSLKSVKSRLLQWSQDQNYECGSKCNGNHVEFCQLVAFSTSVDMYALAAVGRVHGRILVSATLSGWFCIDRCFVVHWGSSWFPR